MIKYPEGKLHWRDYICNLIRLNNFKNCAEIGIWKGDLSFKILEECILENYIMVDPLSVDFLKFDNSKDPYKTTDLYTNTMGEKLKTTLELDEIYNNVVLKLKEFPSSNFIRATSVEASKLIKNNTLDFIFIDAIHTYRHLIEDINCWYSKLKKGGLLSGHDYYKKFPGVIKAVDETFPNKNVYKTIWMSEVLDL